MARQRIFLMVLMCACTANAGAQSSSSDVPGRPGGKVTLAASQMGAAQGRIVVGPNVTVSAGSPGREHAEYVADAHPTDPNRVMVCSMRFSPAKNQLTTVIYVTFDGGKTWSLSLEDGRSRFFRGVFDPACAYGLNSQAFFATIIAPDTVRTESTRYDVYQWWRMGGDSSMHLYRSTDDGRTWGDTVMLPLIDFETVTVDRTLSPYRGRVYIYGNTSGRGFWLIYSADSGRTWARSERTDTTASLPRAGTVLPTGTLVLPYTDGIYPVTTVLVSTSRDGGVHLGPRIVVSQVNRGECTQHGTVTMASDHSTGPFRGRAYAAWADQYRGKCTVHVSYSDDEGKTWSPPVNVGGDERVGPIGRLGKDRLMPRIAVSPRGVVGVTWYDWTADTTHRSTRLRFAASLDGGGRWVPSAVVSAHGFMTKHPPEFPAQTSTEGGGKRGSGRRTDAVRVAAQPAHNTYYHWNFFPGDYTGMAVAADGAFHPFWIDNRSGVGELFTARVTVEGDVARPDADLAPLANVTSAVEVQFTSSVWDARTRTLSWEYQLLNTTKDTIAGPLKMQIVQLKSHLGMTTLVLDRGRGGGVGTVIDLSHALAGGHLLPGQVTPPQRLRVRLDKLVEVPDDIGILGGLDLVHMEVKLYGRGTRTVPPPSRADR